VIQWQQSTKGAGKTASTTTGSPACNTEGRRWQAIVWTAYTGILVLYTVTVPCAVRAITARGLYTVYGSFCVTGPYISLLFYVGHFGSIFGSRDQRRPYTATQQFAALTLHIGYTYTKPVNFKVNLCNFQIACLFLPRLLYYTVSQKNNTLNSCPSRNIDRYSKFFHC